MRPGVVGPAGTSGRGGGNVCRFRRRVLAASVVSVLVMVSLGCSSRSHEGVEIGELVTLAKRVDGGGAECPLSISDRLLRPSTVDPATPVLPLRTGGPGSDGTIVKVGSSVRSVRIRCRYAIGGVAVTVVVAGATSGPAIGVLGDELTRRGDTPTVLRFIGQNKALAFGAARSLPGSPPGAFTRTPAATGDVALIVEADRLQPAAHLPDDAEIRDQAIGIARALVN